MIKAIPDYEGYFIEDNGTVWCNLGKGNRRNNKTTEMYEIKGRPNKSGYLRVYMRNSLTNKRVDKYIHRLVAEMFIPKIIGKTYVNHKDCNRTNNNVDNLEWCTQKENTEQTERLLHIIRDNKGRFISNFDYNTFIS